MEPSIFFGQIVDNFFVADSTKEQRPQLHSGLQQTDEPPQKNCVAGDTDNKPT